MQVPPIDLFEWQLKNSSKAVYNLALSNIHGVSWEEYQQLTGFSIPTGFNLGENSHYGASHLKETLSSMYHCTPANVVTTVGASEANFLVFLSLLEKGDEFIIEQPGYQPMWSAPERLGARRIIWPRTFEEKFQCNLDSLEERITQKTKLIVMTNLHNPSSILSPRHHIEKIAQIAQNHDAYVLIDEIFLDGSFKPQPSSFGMRNVIVTSSVTKVFGLGGLHTGWIIAPQEIATQCQHCKGYTSAASPYISELMTAHALQKGKEQLIQRFQKRVKTNYVLLKNWMKEQRDVLRWVEPDGGIFCFPKFTLHMSSVELCQRLLNECQVLVAPGTYFNQDGYIRLSYGCEESKLKEGLDVLGKGLRKIHGG